MEQKDIFTEMKDDEIENLLKTIEFLFLEEGLQKDNIEEKPVPTEAELKEIGYYEAQIDEILEGYRQGIRAEKYMNKNMNWKQMREVRIGLMQGVDVSLYNNQQYSAAQMKEIRLGLEAGIDVTDYAKFKYAATDMKNMRLKLSETAYFSDNPLITEKQIFDNNTGLTVIISKNRMDAYVMITEQTKEGLSKRDIIKMLEVYGVVSGYVDAGIERAMKNELKNVKIRVAAGVHPTRGRDGYYELFFENKNITHIPVETLNGCVDYREKIVEPIVQKGQCLIRYHHATHGSAGRTVTDVPITGEKGMELAALNGNGIEYNEASGEYIATTEGYVFFDEERSVLNVWKEYYIDGDVNYYTGNINVEGRLHIRGSVGDGAMVSAKGDIIIDGYVAGANIWSGQNVIIYAGGNGNNRGNIFAEGSVTSKFFENFSIRAKGDIKSSYYLNCNISTDGKVFAVGQQSKIMGGNIKAGLGVEASYIGGYMASRVLLDVGNKDDIFFQMAERRKEYNLVENELLQLMLGKEKVERKLDEIELEQNTIYSKILIAIDIKEKQKKELYYEIERLNRVLKLAERAYIKVRVEMYQDTKVILGNRWRRLDSSVKRMVICGKN